MSPDQLDATRRTLLRATAAAGAATLGGVATATPGRSPGPKENEVLVGISAGTDLVGPVRAAMPADAEITGANETLRYVAVRFPDDAPATARDAFVDAVTDRDGVKYAEPNATHHALYAPNDPKYADQCLPQAVNADTAWDTTVGSSAVTVAIIDTGVQYDHPDLDDNFAIDPGYDFVDDDDDPYPDTCDEYHGTAVAGIVAAETGNGTGIAGLGQSTLINGRALDENGSGSTSDIADAIKWAADQGADVINLSLGGGGYTSTMKNAVSYAHNQGSLLVGAAGGDGTSGVAYPAAYSEVVAVSTVDCSGSFSSFSSYGSKVELTAPGVDVQTLSRSCSSDYQRLSGTSFSCAAVSGVAGLTLAQWNLTNTELRNHLKGTAVDIGLSSDRQGCGRVDAANAVGTDPANRGSNCGAGSGGGGGSCGDRSFADTVSDSLSSSSDYDCWSWNWEYNSPCEITVELDGPSNADFGLYVSEGTTACPSPWSYDYRSISTGSQESVTVANPDTSTPLQIDVESYSGSGSYDLTITENAT